MSKHNNCICGFLDRWLRPIVIFPQVVGGTASGVFFTGLAKLGPKHPLAELARFCFVVALLGAAGLILGYILSHLGRLR